MNIVSIIEEYIKKLSDEYKLTAKDNYDFWENHLKYVYEESKILAQKYDADLEIVSLGALLHDIALVKCIGTKVDHHVNGAEIARKVLEEQNYSHDKIDRVVGCVLHHRSSKNATNIEEICVADADILAHFDNISLFYFMGYIKNKLDLTNIKEFISKGFEKDYDDLSEKTKKDFEDRYNLIKNVVLGNCK